MMDAANKKTVLVIDDNAEVLTIITSILQDEFRVVVAKTGEKGLRLADSTPQPSLIYLDYLMPDMNGDDVCRALKRHAITRDIPVVFLTGASEESTKNYLVGFGAVEYIRKPIDAQLLLERTRHYVNGATS